MTNIKLKLAIGFLALGLTSLSFAAKKKVAAPKTDPAMEQAMKMGAPGANHQVLSPLAGKFTATARMWMKPGEAPQESTGATENAWILGGRFLQSIYKGQAMGQSFEGIGTLGYDNLKQKYESVWIDSMMTGTMYASGTYDATTKTVKISGTFSCPMTGKTDEWMRSDWTIQDEDTNIYTSYSKDATGAEFKSMEIVYKRVK
jgi:hypothetical protein